MSDVHVSSVGFSLAIFAALMVLTGVTVGVAYVDLGWMNTPLALIIASVKAALVLAYFMHLRWSPKLMSIVAVAGILWVVILIIFSLADYLSRAQVSGWL